jgi:hypothetical protein
MGVMVVAVEEDVEIHVDEGYQRKNEILRCQDRLFIELCY